MKTTIEQPARNRAASVAGAVPFVLGLLVIPLLAFAAVNVLSPEDSGGSVGAPADAELQYAMHSLTTGSEGGSVIPASCESGYEHYSGECAYTPPPSPLPAPSITGLSCMNNGTQINISWSAVGGASRYLPRFDGADGWCGAYPGWVFEYGSCNHDNYGGLSAVLNLTPGGVHNFWVHAGDPISAPAGTGNFVCPQAPATINYSCMPGGTSVNVWWSGVSGAETYWPRISGVTAAQCASIGWTWDGGATCYTNSYGATSAILPLNPGGTHNIWVHGANSRFYSDAASTGNFSCSAASAPVGYHDYSGCDVNSGVVTGWTCDPNNWGGAVTVHIYRDGPYGTGTYIGQAVANLSRPDVAGACGGTTAHGFNFPIPASLRDGVSHSYYVHAIDDNIYGYAGNPLLGTTGKAATCAIPPPTAAAGSCNAAGTQGTITWTLPAGYPTARVDVDNVTTGAAYFKQNLTSSPRVFGTTPGTTYNWSVRTRYDANNMLSSALTGSFTCANPPATVVNAQATCNGDTGAAQFTWNAVGGNSYTITLDGTTLTTNATTPHGASGLSMGDHTWTIAACTSPGNCTAPTTRTFSCNPTPPTVTLSAENTIVRRGQSAELEWSIAANYPLSCAITGAGMNESIVYTPPSMTGSETTPLLYNTQIFTLTCDSTVLATPAIATARVEVLPDVQEI